MSKSRIKNTLFNLTSGITYRLLIMLNAFIVRTVFIQCLDSVYLGVNGLYASILSMLSLAELGFGTAMVFSMYQPLAEDNKIKIYQLMRLYRKVYYAIGAFILIVGLALLPFLPKMIKGQPDIEGLTFYYVLFLLSTVASYWFFAYRNSLLQADQKSYVISNYNSIFSIIKSVLQIILLVVFHSFTVYLLTQIFCTIAQNITLAIRVKKEYPYIKNKVEEKLPTEDTRKIFKDVKALMLSKVAHTILNSTDNMIISAFLGITWVGLLSNLNLVVEAITGVLCQITASVQASLGNFFAKEDKNAGYEVFKKIEFLNFWLYGFSMIALITLLNPFISIWLGEEYTMSNGVIIALGINFFVAGFMNTLWVFRSTLGLFTQGQYRPLIVAAINLVVSIGLGLRFGVAGVLAGTSISRAAVNLWYDPLIIIRYGFRQKVSPFYMRYLRRILVLGTITLGMLFLSEIIFLNGVSFVSFLIMTFLTAIIPNGVLLLIYYKTEEFDYFWSLIKGRMCR